MYIVYFPEAKDIEFIMRFHCWSAKDVAEKCGVSEKTVLKVLANKQISVTDAKKINAFFNLTPINFIFD